MEGVQRLGRHRRPSRKSEGQTGEGAFRRCRDGRGQRLVRQGCAISPVEIGVCTLVITVPGDDVHSRTPAEELAGMHLARCRLGCRVRDDGQCRSCGCGTREGQRVPCSSAEYYPSCLPSSCRAIDAPSLRHRKTSSSLSSLEPRPQSSSP